MADYGIPIDSFIRRNNLNKGPKGYELFLSEAENNKQYAEGSPHYKKNILPQAKNILSQMKSQYADIAGLDVNGDPLKISQEEIRILAALDKDQNGGNAETISREDLNILQEMSEQGNLPQQLANPPDRFPEIREPHTYDNE